MPSTHQPSRIAHSRTDGFRVDDLALPACPSSVIERAISTAMRSAPGIANPFTESADKHKP